MMVVFDLPVTNKGDQKRATAFRNSLLDKGSRMAQFSVYFRLLDGKEAAESMERRIERKTPERGSI